MDLFLGIDLAWRDGERGDSEVEANETGVVALRPDGTVADAGWVRGIDATVAWITQASATARSALAFVDAALVITNVDRQRLCETDTGKCYGRWKVSANSNNVTMGNREVSSARCYGCAARRTTRYHHRASKRRAEARTVVALAPKAAYVTERVGI